PTAGTTPAAPGPVAVRAPTTAEEARRLLGIGGASPTPPGPVTAPTPAPIVRPLTSREVNTIAEVVHRRVVRDMERERVRALTRV
ncbi:MAG: hypothetical protein KC620_13655, partial [Myxococcales bacterium]|nr:hypothetical protein [Myxococcales bacterium]